MEQRLIDANELNWDQIENEYGARTEEVVACEVLVENAPTVDAVEVVRCKDCKYLNIINKAPLYAYCGKSNYIFHLFEEDTREHFCSWGEKELETM